MDTLLSSTAVKTCGTCGLRIEVCEDCGGKYCSDGCPDRLQDGCMCVPDEEERREDE